MTGRQAAASSCVLLAALGLSFFFGMKTGAAAKKGPGAEPRRLASAVGHPRADARRRAEGAARGDRSADDTLGHQARRRRGRPRPRRLPPRRRRAARDGRCRRRRPPLRSRRRSPRPAAKRRAEGPVLGPDPRDEERRRRRTSWPRSSRTTDSTPTSRGHRGQAGLVPRPRRVRSRTARRPRPLAKKIERPRTSRSRTSRSSCREPSAARPRRAGAPAVDPRAEAAARTTFTS